MKEYNTNKRITRITAVILILVSFMSNAVFAARNEWGDAYVKKAVKNSFTMEIGEDDVDATDDVTRYHAAVTVVHLYEQLYGSIKNVDEDIIRKFEDYRDILRYYDAEQIELIAKATKIGVLKGNKEEDGGLYAYLGDSATRAEMAAFFERAINKMGVELEDNYTSSFRDTRGHWAQDTIDNIASWGVMEGYSRNEFGVDDTFEYQDMLIVFFRICYFEGEVLDLDEFIDGINDSYWVWLEREDDEGSEFSLREFDENLYVGRRYKVKVDTDISGFINSDATWKSSDTDVAKVDKNGVITPKAKGKCKISATCNDMSDYIWINVIKSGSDDDVNPTTKPTTEPTTEPTTKPTTEPTKKMKSTQSVISIQVGDSIDIIDYLLNIPGDLDIKTDDEEFIKLSGTVITGKKATKDKQNAVITAKSEGQQVKVEIRVTNMNIHTNLDPEVEWAANNDTGTVTFTIKGINDDCKVVLNADSDYVAELEKVASDSTWATYKVQGMEEKGGTTCLVIRVLVDGTQIWESDPEIFYFGD